MNPGKDVEKYVYYCEENPDLVVLCGDCLEIMPLLPEVDLVVTDPPYGCGVFYGDTYDDNRSDYWDWLRERISVMRQIGKTTIFTHRNEALKQLSDYDWCGVWHKPGSFGSRIGNSFVLPHWEPIFMYDIHKRGVQSEYLPDVLSVNPEPARNGNDGIGREKWTKKGNGKHPCPKPIALIKRFISISSGGLILDPFLGSGTTLVACKELNRNGIGIEINKDYCEIAKRRLQNTCKPLFTDAAGASVNSPTNARQSVMPGFAG